MPEKHVSVSRALPQSAEAAWAIARDFKGTWHPAIATSVVETGSNGGKLRRFTVRGEDTVYTEQQTFFSDSQCRLSYRHLQGIAGAKQYDATLQIKDHGQNAVAEWTATISAEEPRLTQIAEGTRQVFEMGLAALASAVPAETTSPSTPPAPENIRIQMISGPPTLSILHTAQDAETRVLFLHGIGGRKENWTSQLDATSQHYAAATLDFRGYGESSLGATQSIVEDHCNDILRVMAALKAKRLILVGLSFGSWIATSFAMRHPEKLSGLVLSGGCTGMSEAGTEERERFLALREAPLLQGKTPRDMAEKVVDVIASANATAAARAALYDSMAAITSATYLDALRCFTNPPEKFDFSKLAFPVLFVTGEHDRLASPAEILSVAEKVHAAVPLPNVRFEVLAGAGHVCNLEKPAAYNRLLLEFLSTIKEQS